LIIIITKLLFQLRLYLGGIHRKDAKETFLMHLKETGRVFLADRGVKSRRI